MDNNEVRRLTWGDLSKFTWGDLSNLTWGDLAQPIDVLYERYRNSQLPLTANATEQLERLARTLPEDLAPVTTPKNVGESISFLKRIRDSHIFQIAIDTTIALAITELLKCLLGHLK